MTGAATPNNNNNNTNDSYTLNQLVRVEPRLWAGINRPGGVGRITKIGYCHLGYAETVNIKYIVGGGCDTNVDLAFLQPHTELARTSRSRRGRDFLGTTEAEAAAEQQQQQQQQLPIKKKKKRRTKSPEATRTTVAAATTTTTTNAAAAREVDTKASTKGRMTLQTGGDAAELPPRPTATATTSNKKSHKPPVKYITIGKTFVSPLALPESLKKKSSKSATAAQPKCFVVKKRPTATTTAKSCTTTTTVADKQKQRNKVAASSSSHRVPSTSNNNNNKRSSGGETTTVQKKTRTLPKKEITAATPSATAPVDENTKPPASYIKLQQTQNKTSNNNINKKSSRLLLDAARSPARVLPLSSRRIPLRQVFDNDMDVRNQFVDTVVGEIVEPTKKKTNAAIIDPNRQILFNQCLGQVFSKFGDESVTLQALLTHVNQSLVSSENASFSNKEVDDCLAELSERGRVMVSDGEIYKI
mmetsp:Transcript_13795/g.22844  ORF Transcript_13795/g.22844 Transcript_13795/m.22844 type:complete len:472 (+) Transcript_13795:89-1504(+)|eukprot:CAMPEP_0119008962 /NCGR_PEP_ID=MMETSP1176-20130426/4051_1 /TAXON_ID=265551 /ORGANISM="Synedropsis recta cf, Strain CCMP1620" /LENGTH=471 /DNA_ID=CAMNT_0006961383 /DNA_START=76 /DNA_END=1491 /DNA_ORIENTATION=-